MNKPILEWYHQEPLEGMVKETKVAKSFFQALSFKCFHNYKLLFSHVLFVFNFNFHIPIPIQLHCDNQSCIKLAQNSKFHKSPRHITISYHFLHKQVEKNTIQLIYCSTKKLITNFLTKAIPCPKDEFCVFHSGLHYVEDVL